MNYTILVYETAEELAARTDPKRSESYWAAYTDYSRALAEAGIVRGGAGLTPPQTATTLRVRGGKRAIHDGPFADTKEQLGGFFVIEVADLDQALAWAAKCPSSSTGSVEVRPNLPPPPQA